ncbi:MAG: penicillin acylase family protein [Polyangiaceae bacterium]|nr:penicillin acylase family protein [Polyangiaceae bacterium]
MKPRAEERLRSLAKLALKSALGERLPLLEGKVVAAGLHAPLEIRRDAHGIPSVMAENDVDAFFGLGFCHGQDRAGQLEILVRTVRGTLAEVAGEDGLPVDKLSRRIGFKRAAIAQVEVARPEIRTQLDAYARGINAGMRLGMQKKAHELAFLGCEPTPWDAADPQAVSVLLCFALASNWDVELLRLETWQLDGEEALLAIDAPYPGDLPVSQSPLTQAGRAAERLLEDLGALRALAPLGGASNAWVVGAGRSATGRPILAADPHLPPDVPVHWYLSHIATPTWRVTGASFVGTPGFAIGHNDHCAWGVTAAHADNTDFFIEEVGEDGKSVREGDAFVPCEVRSERIDVKGRPTVIEDVLVTKRGPIVGPVLGRGQTLSMSATWLAKRPYTGLYRAHAVKSRSEFHDLFREGSASSVNLVYADKDGGIAWRLGVEIPVRKAGHGTMPRPGWLADSGWERDPVPFERMPFSDDPREGFVASANNAPCPASSDTPFFGVDWLDGYRQKRIVDVLSARSDWTVSLTQDLQKDTLTPVWDEVRGVVLGVPSSDEDTSRALDLLRSWDGRLDASSSSASVWSLFVASLTTRILWSKAPNTAGRAMGAGFHPALPHTTMITRRMSHLSRLLREQPAGFFDEGWPAAIAQALGAAVRRLREAAGPDPAGWAWGQVRPLRMHHPFAQTFRALDYALGTGPQPFGGDATTIVQGPINLVDPLSGPIAVPNMRLVIDVGGWQNSRYALLAGQSGNPFSAHHADHRIHWEGRGLPIAWSDAEVRRTTVKRLEIVPG